MTVPLGPAGALRIAYELIDAQAAHIKNLERGHWSRETRALVEDKRDELDAAQKATDAGSCCAAGACDPCERVEVTNFGDPEPRYIHRSDQCPHGFHPTSCGMCTGPAEAYGNITGDHHHDEPAPPAGMVAYPFNKGGDLPQRPGARYRDAVLQNIADAFEPQDGTCPSSCAAAHPGKEHPTEHTGPHQTYHYPPKGQCARCDYIRQATQP